MKGRNNQSEMNARRLVLREWPVIFLCVVCLIVAVPDRVAAEINESLPAKMSAPQNSQADFVVFGDSQGSFGYLWPVAPGFDDMLELINQIDVKMAFHVGDFFVGDDVLAMDVRDQADRFLGDMKKLKAAWFPVMGNHDSAGEGWEVSREMIFGSGSTYYSFNYNDCHFVVLDAFMPGYENVLSQEQMTWLKNDLTGNEKPHVFVFVHAPLFSLGGHLGGCLDKDIQFREKLITLLKENGVDVVFNGHEHSYASFGYRGLMQVTTGGSGGQLRSFAEFHELGAEYGYDTSKITRWKTVKTLHYVCVDIIDSEIHISAYDLAGNQIDHFIVQS